MGRTPWKGHGGFFQHTPSTRSCPGSVRLDRDQRVAVGRGFFAKQTHQLPKNEQGYKSQAPLPSCEPEQLKR